MENAISIDDFFRLESENRKKDQWFIFSGWIKNDIELIHVECKSHGKFNQILRINNGINYCFGHSMEGKTIKELKNKYKSILGGVS